MEFKFKEFMDEAYVQAGGAFGKKKNNFGVSTPTSQSAKPQGNPIQRIDGPHDNTANYHDRIQHGLSIEAEIRDRLNEYGLVIEPSSANQDKNQGIDGFITSKDGGKTSCPHIPIQIKARKNSSGNDILWETIKPWDDRTNSNFEKLGDNIFTGKDMKCQATYLISVGNNGSLIRIRKVDEIIQKSKSLAEALIQEYRATGKIVASTQDGQARVVKDPSQQANYKLRGDVFKVNCFLSPDNFEWKKDFNLKSAISMI